MLIENGRCVGVEYKHDGSLTTARCNGEVIVCSGAFGSPRLLLLSGIGPADDLTALGIDVVADLPGVGRNLQDHVLLAGVIYESNAQLPPPVNNGVEAHILWKSDQRMTAPDIQPLIVEFPFPTPELADQAPAMGYTILPSLIRPTSRGVVKLTSADPAADLHIDMNFLASPGDRAALHAALALSRQLGEADAFKSFRKREVMPGTLSGEELEDFIRTSATTYFHPTSSCRMGLDEFSVVDPELKVYGIEGLRIADASIMPEITSGNTNAPSVLIGERCSDYLSATNPVNRGDKD